MDSFYELLSLLERPATFHCRPRAGGFTERDFSVVHTRGDKAAEKDVPDWLPPSMRLILTEIGPLHLFHPEDRTDDGFRLFSVEQCAQQLLQFRETIARARELVGQEAAMPEAENWMDGLCPIAEIVESGDYFAIDTENAIDNGECPILFLDHEYYFSGWLDPDDTETVASDVLELITLVLKDPLPFLESNWTGGGPYDQWFPEAVTFADDG